METLHPAAKIRTCDEKASGRLLVVDFLSVHAEKTPQSVRWFSKSGGALGCWAGVFDASPETARRLIALGREDPRKALAAAGME